MTAHINAKLNDISPLILIAGDPVRTEKMSEQLLKKKKLVSNIRNLFIYTGYYKNIRVTLATSGMGQSSIGIIAYELLKYYQVKVIIRVGTCGLFSPHYQLRDLLCVGNAYSFIPFFSEFYHQDKISGCPLLKSLITKSAQIQKLNLHNDVKIWSTNEFYFQDVTTTQSLVKIYDLDGAEMEAYALFILAKIFHVSAACLLTVSDVIELPSLSKQTTVNNVTQKEISADERASGLIKMFVLGLETLAQFHYHQSATTKTT